MAIGSLPPVIGELPVNPGHAGRRPLAAEFPGLGRADETAPPLPAAAGTVPRTTALEAAVTAALGRQDGLAPVFAAATALGTVADLPPALRDALGALAGFALGARTPPTAGDVAAALSRSGLFHESVGGADLKAALATLGRALAGWLGPAAPMSSDPVIAAAVALVAGTRPAPPRRGGRPAGQGEAAAPDLPPRALAAHLLDAAERAAGRILLHQAASIGGDDAAPGTDDDAPRGLVFEIPLAGPAGVSVAEVRIERDGGDRRERGGGEDDGGPVHRVEMAFALAPLGPVAVRVGLLPGRRVVIGVWCETPAAVARLEAEAGPLADALTAAGLLVSGVDLHLGRPPQRAAAATPAAPRHRLDVEL